MESASVTKRKKYKEYTYNESTSVIPERTLRYWRAKSKKTENDTENSFHPHIQRVEEVKNGREFREYQTPDRAADDDELLNNFGSHLEGQENYMIRLSVPDCDSDGLVDDSNDSLSANDCDASSPPKKLDELVKRTNPNITEGQAVNSVIYNDIEGMSPTLNAGEFNEQAHGENPKATIDTSQPAFDPVDKKYDTETLIQALLLSAIKWRHGITYAATADVSKLLNIENGRLKKISKYKLIQLIADLSAQVSIHHICSHCSKYAGKQPTFAVDQVDEGNSSTGENSTEFIKCENCDRSITVKDNVNLGNIFLHISLKDQLRFIFEIAGDPTSRYRQRKKAKEYAIEDIVDGKLYKRNADDHTISINFNVDGVPIFESSNYSAHPVLCIINELSPKDRRHNVMLASIWCGKGKPDMNEYLKPFVREAIELRTHGFDYTYKGRQYNKKCRILVGVCDSVARPMVQNSTQFNGKYGCGLCLHPGEQVAKDRGTVRVYPLAADGNAYGEGLRSDKQTRLHAQNKEKGLKGRSIVCDIPEFDIVSGLVADWMHAVLLGICRQFAKLWFDSTDHSKDFNFRELVKIIDELLLSYKPSLDISRTPRKISEYGHLKAHELAVWLLNYSLGTLIKIFPMKYVQHWSLLVDGISILLKNTILKSEVYYAQNCLLEFVRGVEELYGNEHVSYNVHLLTHLAQSVLDWGPLWSHSAFIFEDFNQEIRNCVKSSQGVPLQICNNLRLKYTIAKMMAMCKSDLTEQEKLYLDELLTKDPQPKVSLSLNKVHLIGEPETEKLCREHFLALKRQRIDVDQSCHVRYYKRAYIDHELIHTQSYSRVLKRASYFVLLEDGEIFQIFTFIVFPMAHELQCYAIGNYFQRKKNRLIPGRRLEHIIVLEKLFPNLAAVSASLIQGKVTVIENKVSNVKVATIQPSRIEFFR